MKLFDISIPIHEGMITYPGNPDVKITKHRGATSVHSELSFGSHTGTHVDAPSHVFERGKTLSDISLPVFFGPARVLDMTHAKQAVSIDDLKKEKIKKGERILLKTKNSQRGFVKFYDDYICLDGDAADYLAEKKVLLVGIDALSIKKRGGKDLRPHTSLLGKNIPIIEGLNFKGIKAGMYTFAGFPLSFSGLDGSPIRAVLLK